MLNNKSPVSHNHKKPDEWLVKQKLIIPVKFFFPKKLEKIFSASIDKNIVIISLGKVCSRWVSICKNLNRGPIHFVNFIEAISIIFSSFQNIKLMGSTSCSPKMAKSEKYNRWPVPSLIDRFIYFNSNNL